MDVEENSVEDIEPSKPEEEKKKYSSRELMEVEK